MLLLAPLYSTRTKSKHRQMIQLLPFHFFWRKNCTVPSGGKFSPVFPVKRKALLQDCIKLTQKYLSETAKRFYVSLPASADRWKSSLISFCRIAFSAGNKILLNLDY